MVTPYTYEGYNITIQALGEFGYYLEAGPYTMVEGNWVLAEAFTFAKSWRSEDKALQYLDNLYAPRPTESELAALEVEGW